MDSRSLLDVINQATVTIERSLIIDIAAAREAYERLEISYIGLLHSDFKPADWQIKIMLPAQLMDLMSSVVLRHTVEQFVIRNNLEDAKKNKHLV